jgi:hypothetical protein
MTTPLQRTYVLPPDPSLLGRIPRGSGIVLEISEDQASLVNRVEAHAKALHLQVRRIIVSSASLESFFHSAGETLEQELDVSVQESPSMDAILSYAKLMKTPRRRFSLPLRNSEDSLRLMTLSSLGVSLLIDLRAPELDWREAIELVADSLLNRASRGSLAPADHLMRALAAGGGFLGAAYHEDPRCDRWCDAEGRMALSRKDRSEGRWIGGTLGDEPGDDAADAAHGRGLLLGKHACSYCEGFFLCRGYLLERGGGSACHDLLLTFLDSVRLRGPIRGRGDG